jgi:hypothetical protein
MSDVAVDEPDFTITLTSRPPIRIVRAIWPILAGSAVDVGDQTATLTVRQRVDGDGAIVYGVLRPSASTPGRRRGVLLERPLIIPTACRGVALDLLPDHPQTASDLAEAVIAKLPAERLP